MWYWSRSALVVLTLLGLSGCQDLAGPVAGILPEGVSATGLTELTACSYRPAGSDRSIDAECGTLVVPEAWGRSNARLIALPVIRIPATGDGDGDPAFWLEGGPGESNLAWEPQDWLMTSRDVVMVGYRGVDGSVNLACPELGRRFKSHLGRDLFSSDARAEYALATERCADFHTRTGADLSAYTIPAVVQDMEAARGAMGYERINLLSVSYGTRVAQIYAYMFPDSINRAILIAVNTPGYFVGNRDDLDELIKHVAILCAKDPRCSLRTDDLAAVVAAVNHEMPSRWLFLPIDPGTVRLGAHFMLLGNRNMALVFDAYLAAAEGDPSGLAMANLMTLVMTPIDQFVYGEHFSKGGSAERDRYRGIESISLGGSTMGVPMSEWGWPAALLWPVELIPDELRSVQKTEVEILLVNGTIDFATPPMAMVAVGDHFVNAQSVLLPEFSHSSDVVHLQPRAFEHLVTTYFDTGVADASQFSYEPLSFETGLSLPAMAKILVVAILATGAVLLSLTALGLRRWRKKQSAAGR